MNTTPTTDRDLRRYLLGTLDEEASDGIELEMLADDETYAGMLAHEDELIDAYARGELPDGERLAFEARFLPRRGMEERVAFARRLERLTLEGRRQPRADAPSLLQRLAAWLAPAPALRLAPIAALLLLAVATGWLAFDHGRLNDRVETLQADNVRLGSERADAAERLRALDAELAAARQVLEEAAGDGEELEAAHKRIEALEHEITTARRVTQRRKITAPFVLSLATRSESVRTLSVPAAAEAVRLQLDAAGEERYHDAFQVRLLGPRGVEVWSAKGLTAGSDGTVTVEVDAALLPDGRYEALLESAGGGGAGELVGSYEFEIERR